MDSDRDEEIKIINLPFIQTSFRYASMRQIHAAIDHFYRGDVECAVTLATAACGMLPATDNDALPASETRTARIQTVSHWLAHGTDLDRTGKSRQKESIVIRTAQVGVAIYVAITRFDIAFPDQKTPQMISFRRAHQF